MTVKTPVYLDYASTTPVDPRVAEVMSQCLTMDGNFGNPASRSHLYGWKAEEAVEIARQQVADLIHADPREIVWTSGATESNNLAIKGVTSRYQKKGKHLITSKIEHKAVLDCFEQLEIQGFEITYLEPDKNGVISSEQVAEAVRDDTIFTSLMHVNNEVGAINDIARIGNVCRAKGIIFHVDAAQSASKLPLDMSELPVDLISFSSHKAYGPKGMGALYVRRQPRVRVEAQIHGGGHERGLRSGTLATHQIVGMGEAFRLVKEEMANDTEHARKLSDTLLSGLKKIDDIHLNGVESSRVPHINNIGFHDVDGEILMMSLKDLAVSTGSACTSASVEPSYVLRAIGLSDQLAHSSLRISVGRFTSLEDIEFSIEKIRHTVTKLRERSTLQTGS